MGESPTHAPATKIAPLEAPAHCIAGAGDPPCIISCVYAGYYTTQPQSGCLMTVALATGGVATGRDPPTGGTLPARANNFSKIAARQRNIFAKKRKKEKSFLKN